MCRGKSNTNIPVLSSWTNSREELALPNQTLKLARWIPHFVALPSQVLSPASTSAPSQQWVCLRKGLAVDRGRPITHAQERVTMLTSTLSLIRSSCIWQTMRYKPLHFRFIPSRSAETRSHLGYVLLRSTNRCDYTSEYGCYLACYCLAKLSGQSEVTLVWGWKLAHVEKCLISLVADDVIYSKPTAVTITSVTVENYMENYMATDVQATIIFLV